MRANQSLITLILGAAVAASACAVEPGEPAPPANPELGKADGFAEIISLDDGPRVVKLSAEAPLLLKGANLARVELVSTTSDAWIWTWGADKRWSWSEAGAGESAAIKTSAGPTYIAVEALDDTVLKVQPLLALVITDEQIQELEAAAARRIGEMLDAEGLEHEDDVDVDITDNSWPTDLEFDGVMTVTLTNGCPDDDKLEELERKAVEQIQEMLDDNDVARALGPWDVTAEASCEDGVLTITVNID